MRKVADVSATAAVESAAGALSRAFASAEVMAADFVRTAVTPHWLSPGRTFAGPRGCVPVSDQHGRRQWPG